jgi:hypothetical protein
MTLAFPLAGSAVGKGSAILLTFANPGKLAEKKSGYWFLYVLLICAKVSMEVFCVQ